MTTTTTVTLPDVGAHRQALLDLARYVRGTGYRFVTVTPETHARVNARPANAEARGLRDVLGWSRPFDPAVLPTELFRLMTAADVLEPAGEGRFRSRVRFSTFDGRLYLHSAYPTTGAEAVFFGPDTYRMAEAAVRVVEARDRPVRRAVDVGCGTGAGGITVAARCPGVDLHLTDINPAALEVAAINAELAGIDGVTLHRTDLLDGVPGEFDLIVSNPPFMIDPAGRLYRDGGGEHGHGLSLRVLDQALGRLAPGGSLVLFTGTGIVEGEDPFLRELTGRLAGEPVEWTYREDDPDVYDEELDTPAYAHAERIAVVVLTVTRPD